MNYEYYDDGYGIREREFSSRKENDVFLFLILAGNLFELRALSIGGHDLHSVLPVFSNMFPGVPVLGVFRVSMLEAFLMSGNFRTHGATIEHLRDYLRNACEFNGNPLIYANSSGYTNVYLDRSENGGYRFSMNKTGSFFGFIVNQDYVKLLNLFLHGKRITATVTGFNSADAAIGCANVKNARIDLPVA